MLKKPKDVGHQPGRLSSNACGPPCLRQVGAGEASSQNLNVIGETFQIGNVPNEPGSRKLMAENLLRRSPDLASKHGLKT